MGIFRGADPQLLRDQFRRQLQPGAVVRFEAQLSSLTTKFKIWVVVAVDDVKADLFIINSAIPAFVRSSPPMLKCQALMRQASHPFMHHDSYVNCHRPRTYNVEDLLTEFVNDALGNGSSPILGLIEVPAMRNDIVAKLLQSNVTSTQEKSRLAASLNSI
jgi:hypothetical protein